MANVEHSALTGTDLHEPKGIAAAAANRLYVSNGAGSGSWSQAPASAIASAGVLVFQSQLYHIRDERSSGVNGDTLSLSTWNTRALNTEKTDDLGITTTSNQMSLVAGTYYVQAEAITHFLGQANNSSSGFTSKLRLRNVTDSTTLVDGLSFFWNDRDNTNVNFLEIPILSTLSGRFTLSGTKSVEIQNWITSGLIISTAYKGGKAVSSGENEVYLDLKLWKLS